MGWPLFCRSFGEYVAAAALVVVPQVAEDAAKTSSRALASAVGLRLGPPVGLEDGPDEVYGPPHDTQGS